ncbi:iron complex transport system substrate-binding protein [Halovenus aranensis]|jgi:iron complex transport system substrate-binding protein|uniref:Iron complex transport system substrate-binding protein n=1 Tax=Halovenus aranensis TaxID=890420 RepID=A0A1G8UAT8_9EURY|nr:cobalamin-binding protein [Halovenus aranensis]SDJ50843.1 iron complex transport system substrate-binding protein [Halovenus aranensis]
MRVVSTSPSSTEILYALGVQPVAVSHACDYPPAVENRPVIDVSKVDAKASADRHEQVQAATADGHVYRMDADTLDTVEPDLIVTQGVCGVCAVDEVLVDETVAELDADPDVVALQAHTLDDVLACIRDVGEETDTDDRARALVEDLRRRIEAVERQRPADDRPRTAVLEWLDPPRPAGSWVPDVVTAAGGEYGLGEAGERSQAVEWEAVREYDPERLVVAPCGFDLERTRRRLHELTDRPGWDEITAVQTGQVYALDGSAYLTRWTPRIVDAVEHLARICHPETFGSPVETMGVARLRRE